MPPKLPARPLINAILGVLGLSSSQVALAGPSQKIAPPPAGKFYHGTYPGGITGEEDDITAQDVATYTGLAGHGVAWVYFSNNWNKSRAFPVEMATWIRKTGAVPFIRLMLRHSTEEDRPPGEFKLQNIIDGKLDEDLAKWGDAAREFGTPLLVEYGTEVNGRWFPWNGVWNGKSEGPKHFIAAYRHIVELIRNRGATNVSWVFHANPDDDPETQWNRLESYYPGDDVVDWLGLSAYGYRTPNSKDPRESFRKLVDEAYPRLAALSPKKPIMVLEFGHTTGHPRQDAAAWANDALADLFAKRWPRIAGFSWWNERWENDDVARHNTTMRLQDVPSLASVFRRQLDAHGPALQESPVFTRIE